MHYKKKIFIHPNASQIGLSVWKMCDKTLENERLREFLFIYVQNSEKIEINGKLNTFSFFF